VVNGDGSKTMLANQKGYYSEFPPPCRRCGEIIGLGEKYYPHRSHSNTKPYCERCEGEMYI